MRFLLITLLLVAGAGRAISGAVPLTAKEISLMLRSGYSSEAVMHELSARHFAGRFDSELEKQLVQAGANQSLIDALRNGAYRMSDSEIAAIEAKLAAQAEKAALEQSTEASRAEETENAVPVRAKAPPAAAEPSDLVYRLLKGSLVYWHYGSLSRFDDEVLEHKKLYLFFFSSNKTRTGRKFTPQLIEYYNRVAPQHPEFEVIFFSADSSQFGMETYMGQSNMPWPAVAYDKIGAKAAGIQSQHVHGIPCLILVNGSGDILLNSGGDENDTGLEKVIVDLDQIFARNSAGAVARTH